MKGWEFISRYIWREQFITDQQTLHKLLPNILSLADIILQAHTGAVLLVK